jgi:hypothetical protein
MTATVFEPRRIVQPPQRARPHPLSWQIWSDAPRAQLWRRAFVAAFVLLGLASLRFAVQSLAPADVYRKDLVQEYVLARTLLERANPYVPIAALAQRHLGVPPSPTSSFLPSAHPPTAGLLFLPFVLLDYPVVAGVWLMLEVVLLIVSVRLLAIATGQRLTLWLTLAWSAALLAWHAAQTDLFWGQLSLTQLCLVAGAAAAFRAGRDSSAGFLIGLAILLKPLLAPVVLVLFLCRRWRALTLAAAVVVVGYAIAIWAIGVGPVTSYFTHALPANSEAYRGYVGNRSLWSLVSRLFAGTGSPVIFGMQAPPLIAAPGLVSRLSVLAVAATLVPVCLRIWRRGSVQEGVSTMLCVTLLISPISWTHYSVLLLLPAAYVLHELWRRSWPRTATNVALVSAVTLAVDPDVWGLVGFAAGSAVTTDQGRVLAIASIGGLLAPLAATYLLLLLTRWAAA